ncbi:MAG: lysophospholipid acyltransferase family protein [Polyangiaceae bacterium]|nr:lysophospholipid acyltransferase family protein [Polyangiaceae bacterium]
MVEPALAIEAAPRSHAAPPPRRLVRSLAVLLGWVVGGVLRVRRRHVEQSVRQAGIADAAGVAKRMYRELARGLLDLLALGLRRSGSPSDLVKLDESLVAWLSGHQGGAVVATAHTAGWDVLACAAAERVELTVVSKRLSVRWLDALWQRLRHDRGVALAHPGAAAHAARAALARGGVVAMMIDQAPERRRGTVVQPFLGRAARIDLAPALLAARARVPLVVVFGRRGRDGVVTGELRGVLCPPARGGRAWAEAAMREATRALDRFVRERPEQWLWMHRRWKDARGARP